MSSLARGRPVRWVLAALGAVTILHLGLIETIPGSPAAIITKALLMPLLAGVVVAGAPRPWPRVVQLVLVALGLCWLGDAVPEVVDLAEPLLLSVGLFLLAQVAYCAAFWPWRRSSLPAARPWVVMAYLAAYVLLVFVVRDGVGALFVPVAMYGLVLTTMAVLASGLGRLAAIGGITFWISDALLAVRVFTGLDLPGQDMLVMLTYVVGQVLVVLGVLSQAQATADPPVSASARG